MVPGSLGAPKSDGDQAGGLGRAAQLSQGFRERHCAGHCHVQTAPSAGHRDCHGRIAVSAHDGRNPRALASQKQAVSGDEAKIVQGSVTGGRQQNNAAFRRSSERGPIVVMPDIGMFGVVQSPATQEFQRKREATRLDHVNRDIQACTQPDK